jgi:pimeloyl-ACP methyl ester carboxylesterase
MNIATLILLATFGAQHQLPRSQGGPLSYHFVPAPPRGDLVREGLHPLAILLPMHQHKQASMAPLARALHLGGFAVLSPDYRHFTGPYTTAWNDVELLRRRISKQPGVDPTRVFLVGASVGSSVAIDLARRRGQGVAGLVLMSPGLNYLGLKVLPMLAELPKVPVLMTADVQERMAVRTLRTVLKTRLTRLHRLVRAGIGHGSDQFTRSPTMADQIVIMMRTWAEKNCDRTKPKKNTLNEGCTK